MSRTGDGDDGLLVDSDVNVGLISALRGFLPLSLIELNTLLSDTLLTKGFDEIKQYCIQQLTDCYSAHASSTHPVLRTEYEICLLGGKRKHDKAEVPSLLAYIKATTTLERLVDVIRDARPVIAAWLSAVTNEYRRSGSNSRPAKEYALSWAKLPYQPLNLKLESWDKLFELRNHVRLLNDLAENLVPEQGGCSIFRKSPPKVTIETVEEYLRVHGTELRM
jgi:hypothetical protein